MGSPWVGLLLIFQSVQRGGSALGGGVVVTPFASDLFLFLHPVSYTHIISLSVDGWFGVPVLIFSPL